MYQFSLVQFSHSVVSDSLWPPWIAACQASLSITNSRNLLKLMPIESVMPSSHLILCRPLLLLPPIPPSIRVFSNFTSESEKVGLKLNIQKSKIMASGPITSWQIDGETVEIVTDFIFGAPKSLQMVTAAMKLKDAHSLGRKDVCIPMANSCWGLTENNKIL